VLIVLRRLISADLIKKSSVYFTTGVVNAIIPIALLPILTNNIPPAEYGLLSMFQIFVNILVPFIGLNMETSMVNYYYKGNRAKFGEYLGTCLLLFISFSSLFLLIFFFSKTSFSSFTGIPDYWIVYIVIVASSQVLVVYTLTYFQINEQPWNYGLLQIFQSLLNISLTVFLVLFLQKSYGGRLAALIVSGLISSMLCVFYFLRNKIIKMSFTLTHAKHALKVGFPLIPHMLGAFMFTAIDRILLTNLVGLEMTGQYTVSYQVGSIFSFFTVAFNNAYVPWLFNKLNENSIAVKLKIVKMTYSYFCIIVIFAFLLILFVPYVIRYLIQGSYNDLNLSVVFIISGMCFQGMYFMVTNYLTYVKKTHLQAAVTISVALFKIPMSYFLILWLGGVGASVSFALTFFIYFIVTWVVSAKNFSMPYGFLFRNRCHVQIV
jgi:O-antigen/teichoic acid export membrane protein